MRTITLSGWGQPADALNVIAPDAAAIDYAHHTEVKAALADISAQAKNAELIIGWSLGGQLAVRGIAAGSLKPKKLVLIAAPFQFAARPEDKFGMPMDLYRVFRDNYANNPERTLTKAWATIVKGDSKAADIRHQLEKQDKAALLQKDWLAWLDVLQHFSCKALYLADFPATLLIHGDQDAVVYHEQSLAFAKAIPHAKLITLAGCGHAPHWHSSAAIQQLIHKFSHV